MASKKGKKKAKSHSEIQAVPEKIRKGRGEINVLRFALTYLFLMGGFFVLIGLRPIQNIIDLNGLYTKGVVVLTSKVLDAIGIQGTYQGSIIRLPSVALDVKFGCNGLEAVMIYSVAVIAFPASWKSKVLGILGGFVILQVVNILRIASLSYSAVYFKSLFEYIHIYIAQGLMIAVSLGIFFLYLNYAKKPYKASA